MTAQKDRLTRLLGEIGACWAVTTDKTVLPNDPLEDQIAGRKTYHIHPDKSEPRTGYIQRFTNLKELEAWIRKQRPATWRARRRDWKRINVKLPDAWIELLKRKDGSFQDAIERLVRNELGSFS